MLLKSNNVIHESIVLKVFNYNNTEDYFIHLKDFPNEKYYAYMNYDNVHNTISLVYKYPKKFSAINTLKRVFGTDNYQYSEIQDKEHFDYTLMEGESTIITLNDVKKLIKVVENQICNYLI